MPEPLARTWFLGDSCITRYAVEPSGQTAQVRPFYEGNHRGFRCTLKQRDQEMKFSDFRTLIAALQCGEEWLP